MSETLTIRSVETADLPEVADLWCDLQRAHEPFHPCWSLSPEARDRYLDHLRDLAGSETTVLRVVVEASGKIVGYCHGRVETLPPHHSESCIGNIIAISVDPAVRDGGIGSALLNSVVDELGRGGITRIEMTLSADNAEAIRFAERARFHLHTVTLTRELT